MHFGIDDPTHPDYKSRKDREPVQGFGHRSYLEILVSCVVEFDTPAERTVWVSPFASNEAIEIFGKNWGAKNPIHLKLFLRLKPPPKQVNLIPRPNSRFSIPSKTFKPGPAGTSVFFT